MGNNIIQTAGVLIIKNGKVLLVRHNESAEHLSGRHGLPAGRMKNNESAKEAACRELKEETGLDVNLDSLILLPGEWQARIDRKNGIKQIFSLTVFLTDKFEGQSNGNAETTPEWIDLEGIGNCDLLPNVKEIINTGLKLLQIQ